MNDYHLIQWTLIQNILEVHFVCIYDIFSMPCFHDILSRLSVFDNGSVWALYLLHVIIRTALFCSLNILSDLKPHDNTQYCRWGRIKLLYKILDIFWCKNRSNLHIIPSDLDILFDIFVPVHPMSNSDRLSKLVTRSIICSFKFSCGIRSSMFRCLWWKS